MLYIYPLPLAYKPPTVLDLGRSPIRKTVLVNLQVSGTVAQCFIPPRN